MIHPFPQLALLRPPHGSSTSSKCFIDRVVCEALVAIHLRPALRLGLSIGRRQRLLHSSQPLDHVVRYLVLLLHHAIQNQDRPIGSEHVEEADLIPPARACSSSFPWTPGCVTIISASSRMSRTRVVVAPRFWPAGLPRTPFLNILLL